jgi:hypothetical protein
MSIINKGTSFANGEQLTADKINDLIDLATFNQDATDSQTTDVNSAGQIVVNQGGIDTAQLATGAVTKSRIENVANMKALGNTSGSAAAPQEVAILDEDTMSSDSATSLATQQSIKAFVETSKTSSFTPTTYTGGETTTFPNGLIIKFGQVTSDGSSFSITFGTAFPNACISVQGTTIALDSTKNMGITAFSTTTISVNPLSAGTYTWLAIGH